MLGADWIACKARSPSPLRDAPMIRWTPSDYVLHGRYCETDSIASCLNDIRRAARASSVLLIAFRGRTLFHSLLLISHCDPKRRRTLQRALVSHPYTPGSDVPPFARMNAGSMTAAKLCAELARHRPFSDLTELFEGKKRLLRPLLDRTSSQTEISPASLFVLVFESNRGVRSAALRCLSRELHTMVNASAPVVVNGSLEAEREVDAKMDHIERSSELFAAPSKRGGKAQRERGVAIPPTVLKELLNAALSLTRSSIGNIYFALRDGKTLGLAAATRNAKPIRSIPIKNVDSVVPWVFDRRRPMIINDIRDYTLMHPASGYRSVAAKGLRPYAELAVPIVEAGGASATGNVIGVINIEKASPLDTSYYTYRDLAILRSIAGRISLWCVHGLLVDFSRSLAQLTGRNALPVHGSEQGAQAHEVEIPADALDAKNTINDALRSVYELTRSHSATVRLLSADRQHIVRFCAFPTGRLADKHRLIATTNTASVNAWVVRTGRECHIPSLRSRPLSPLHPGLTGALERAGTESELCLPLLVNGRVVGTFNLESRYRGGYADSLELVRAAREQVSLALQYAQRAHEQTVLSMMVSASANLHQLLKVAERLATAHDPVDLKETSRTIMRLIDPARARVTSSSPMTTTEIIAEVAAELRYQDIILFRNKAPVTIRHSGIQALMLKIIFRELFRNAYDASGKVKLRCTIRWLKTSVGGKQYLTLNIANPIRFRVAPDTTSKLFRVPLFEKKGRTHIGAFTAGALARNLGGDIYVHRNSPPLFVVGFDLPISEENANT